MKIELGPFTAGEIPEQLVYTFKDSTGELMNLSGFSGEFHYRKGDNTVVAPAVVDGSTITHTWQTSDLAESGLYSAVFWVGDGTHRYASVHFLYRVLEPPQVAPNI